MDTPEPQIACTTSLDELRAIEEAVDALRIRAQGLEKENETLRVENNQLLHQANIWESTAADLTRNLQEKRVNLDELTALDAENDSIANERDSLQGRVVELELLCEQLKSTIAELRALQSHSPATPFGLRVIVESLQAKLGLEKPGA